MKLLFQNKEREDKQVEERIYGHMRNTLRDIKIILNKKISDKEKIEQLRFTMSLLESVECGTIVTSDILKD